MSTTNFTIRQGETWSKVLNLEDSNCIPIILADVNRYPQMYFAGLVTKPGETSIPIRFKYGEVETRTYGRGRSKRESVGIFDVRVYIPADEVGSCSVVGNETRTECNSAGGTWTVDVEGSLLTTLNMATGVWSYEVRKGVALDVSGAEISETLLYGTLTVEAANVDLSAGSSFTFITPT